MCERRSGPGPAPVMAAGCNPWLVLRPRGAAVRGAHLPRTLFSFPSFRPDCHLPEFFFCLFSSFLRIKQSSEPHILHHQHQIRVPRLVHSGLVANEGEQFTPTPPALSLLLILLFWTRTCSKFLHAPTPPPRPDLSLRRSERRSEQHRRAATPGLPVLPILPREQ
jgi:hypothetical protein